MHTSHQTAPSSADKFTIIFNAALKEYKRVTGQHLHSHPFAAKLDTCYSPEAISNVLGTQARVFSTFHRVHDELMTWLNPTIPLLFTFSAALGDGTDLPFSPAKTIFTGIGVLLGSVRDVANHDVLIHLFRSIHFFLQRMNTYAGIPPTNEMLALLGRVMAQLLSILGLSTNALMGRGIKNILKRRARKTDVDDALLELDMLTKEECPRLPARNSEVTRNMEATVSPVNDNAKLTKAPIKNIDDFVKVVTVLTEDFDDYVKMTKVPTEDIDDHVTANTVFTEVIDDYVKVTKMPPELAPEPEDIDDYVMVTWTPTEEVSDGVKVAQEVARIVDHSEKSIENALADNSKRNQGKLRAWLSPPDPSSQHNTARDSRHDETTKWFVQGSKFEEWKRNGSLLWIRGNPGTGKTILCSAIIEDIKSMREAKSSLIAYHYFDFKDASTRNIRGLLASLLFQLSDDSERCCDVLNRLYSVCHDGSDQPTDVALARCLNSMLKLPGQLPIFIVIDALDECPDTDGTPSAREEVLNVVEDLVGSNHSNLFLCITSRPEQDIESVLNPLTSALFRVSLHEEGGQRGDINAYVRSFVYQDRAMRRWSEGDKELVIGTLSQQANGVFLWALFQLNALRRCPPSGIRKTLNELPTTLDDTYERTLQAIPKAEKRNAHRLFQCLVAAIRPLRVDELEEIFAIVSDPDAAPHPTQGWRRPKALEAVLSACSTLIAVIDSKGSKTVRFSHFSVREFLTSDRLPTGIRHYHTPLNDAHTVLARACLTVLLQLDEKTDKRRLATFPLAFYAAQNWVSHAKFDDVTPQVQDVMERLFEPSAPYLAAWAWIHDVDRRWGAQSIDDLPECPSRQEVTALYYAVLCGFSELARHLIVAHAEDVNAKCGHYKTPLRAALHMGHLDVARVLLDHGAYMALGNRDDLFATASRNRNFKVMQFLLEHGASGSTGYDASKFLLEEASSLGQEDVVRLLLQHESDVNARGSSNLTPLHWASSRGHAKAAQLLLERGADVDARSMTDNTPLHLAARNGHLEVARVLLAHGADPRIRGQFDRTPFQVAKSMKHDEISRLLPRPPAVEHGAAQNVMEARPRAQAPSSSRRRRAQRGHALLRDVPSGLS